MSEPTPASVLRSIALPGLLALLALALLWPQEPRSLAVDSFGVGPAGHRALYQLFEELDLEVARSYARPAGLDPEAVVWWVAPRKLCEDADGEDADSEDADASPAPNGDAAALRAWIEAGGTAVVALGEGSGFEIQAEDGAEWVDGSCASLAGERLPPRVAPALVVPQTLPERPPTAPGARPERAEDETDEGEEEGALDRWLAGELGAPSEAGFVAQRIEGPLSPRARTLRQPPLRRFAGAGGFSVEAELEGAPFVLARRLGSGRLVVVADAAFLENRHLARADAAPLALDLARAYGVPALDERAHGLRAETRPHVYLARSRALPVFLGLALLGLLALGVGSALPPREVAELDPAAPELDRFVDSLATLYARSRDHARLDASHRAMSLARLRRHFGLPPETSEEALRARLARSSRLSQADRDTLFAERPPRGVSALRAAARRRDALVEEMVR